MRTGPLTVLPTSTSEPVSGGGTVPVVPVMVSGPFTVLWSNSTPPLLEVRLTGPVIVLPAQAGPSSSLMTTSPLVPETASGPVMLAPQARTAVAPETDSGPASWAPSMSSAPPAWTVTAPFWV